MKKQEEMMEITRITEENIDLFLPLLPERMDFSRDSLLGLIGDDDEAVAAMILSGTSAMAGIEWLYVDPDRRREGAASEFLKLLFQAFEGDVDAICVSYPSGLEGADEFFYANGFFQTEGDPVWLIPVKTALELPEIKKIKKLKDKPNIKAYTLDKLSGGMRRLFDQFVRAEMGETLLLDSCDPAASIGVLNMETMTFKACVLLDRLAERRYQISLLLNRGNGILVAYLLYAFLKVFEGKDLSDITVQFAAVNEHVEKFAEGILGDNEGFLKERLRYSVLSLR